MKLIKNSKSKFVKLRDKYVNDFPLIEIKEENLWISERYTFSNATYIRPVKDSKVGRIEVQLFNEIQEIQFFWLEVTFAHTERERIEDAKSPDAFKIQPEAILGPIEEITINDISNKYPDVVIEGAKANTKKHEVEVSFYLNEENRVDPKIYKTKIFVDNKEDKDKLKDLSVTGEIDINVLKLTNQEVKQGVTLTLEDIENFEISEKFLAAPPPVVPEKNIVIPKKDIILQKVTYIPPLSIDSRVGYLQVEYQKSERVINERVAFEFPATIRQSAEALVHAIPAEEFVYAGPSRKVTPKEVDKTFFRYNGKADIDIDGVIFDKNLINDDSRFTHLFLLIKCRTAIVKVPMALEFELSRNEYKHKAKTDAKTENGSILFSDKVLTPKRLFEANEGNAHALKELIRGAEIVDGYSYSSIKNLEVINFLPDSRIAMFKVHAIEDLDGEKVLHIFEKQHMMNNSYYEWKLDLLKADNIQIDGKYISNYPPQSLHEKTFISTDEYAIQWIQYIPPLKDEKQVDVKIKVAAGERSKFIIKKLTFPLSISEHLFIVQKKQILKFLKGIKASDLTIDIDVTGQPVKQITPDDIIGVPSGVDCAVKYSPPAQGKKSTRVIVKLTRGIYSTGFEQTIIFAEPQA